MDSGQFTFVWGVVNVFFVPATKRQWLNLRILSMEVASFIQSSSVSHARLLSEEDCFKFLYVTLSEFRNPILKVNKKNRIKKEFFISVFSFSDQIR